jgi:hypothetical protein
MNFATLENCMEVSDRKVSTDTQICATASH